MEIHEAFAGMFAMVALIGCLVLLGLDKTLPDWLPALVASSGTWFFKGMVTSGTTLGRRR